jgi:hypothetical protein
METNQKSFGKTAFTIQNDDVIKDSLNPLIRLLDDDGLVGIFSLKTLEVIEDNGLDDCDIILFNEAMRLNRNSFIEGWNDIARYEGKPLCQL